MNEVANYWQQVLNINNWQTSRISKIIIEKLFGTIAEKKIVILGFSFKANTNDTRESPAITICKELLIEGGNLFIYDPKVDPLQIDIDLKKGNQENNEYNTNEGTWSFTKNIYTALTNADAIIILTEWQEFKNLDWLKISKLMRRPAWIFDTRYLLDPKDINHIDINYWRIGQGNSNLNDN